MEIAENEEIAEQFIGDSKLVYLLFDNGSCGEIPMKLQIYQKNVILLSINSKLNYALRNSIYNVITSQREKEMLLVQRIYGPIDENRYVPLDEVEKTGKHLYAVDELE